MIGMWPRVTDPTLLLLFDWSIQAFQQRLVKLVFFCLVMQEGTLLHNLLPRTLRRISEGDPWNETDSRDFQTAFAAVQAGEDVAPAATDNWEELLVDLKNTGDLSPAEINQKRKQMTFKTFQQEDFIPKTLLLEYLVGPLVHGMDELLSRSGYISDLHHLPTLDPSKGKELAERCGGILGQKVGFPIFTIFQCFPSNWSSEVGFCHWGWVIGGTVPSENSDRPENCKRLLIENVALSSFYHAVSCHVISTHVFPLWSSKGQWTSPVAMPNPSSAEHFLFPITADKTIHLSHSIHF